MYDGVIGRFTTVDPAGQFFSPYVGMGNNHINMIDPDGAFSKFGAWWRNGFSMQGVLQDNNGDWGIEMQEWISNDGASMSHLSYDLITGDRLSQKTDFLNSYQVKGEFSGYLSFGPQAGLNLNEYIDLTVNLASFDIVEQKFYFTLDWKEGLTLARENKNIFDATQTTMVRQEVAIGAGGFSLGAAREFMTNKGFQGYNKKSLVDKVAFTVPTGHPATVGVYEGFLNKNGGKAGLQSEVSASFMLGVKVSGFLGVEVKE